MILKEKVSRISLIILVSLSLVLSYFIWTSPIQSPKKEENQQMSVTNQPTVVKANTEVFLPSQVVWHQNEEKKVSTKESLIQMVQQELQKSKIGSLSLRHLTQDKEYQELLQKNEGIELDYVGDFLLSEYAKVYNIPFKKISQSVRFNRLLIDLNQKKIFVMNDVGRFVYEGSIEINQQKLLSILGDAKQTYVRATIGNEVLPYCYYTDKSLSLPRYSYIVSTQPYTIFTRAFFEKPNDFIISNNEDALFYDTPKEESLEISNNNGKVYFKTSSRLSSNENKEPQEMNLFKDSYTYISRLGVQFGNMRYFDEENGMLNFTTFIEGYPLFSKDNRGQLAFRFDQEDNLEISTNVQTIQIPIPSDNEVVLESTVEVFKRLRQKNINMSQITDVQIGYQWQNVEETSQVVNLIPQWFIHYENHWWSEDELFHKIQKEGET